MTATAYNSLSLLHFAVKVVEIQSLRAQFTSVSLFLFGARAGRGLGLIAVHDVGGARRTSCVCVCNLVARCAARDLQHGEEVILSDGRWGGFFRPCWGSLGARGGSFLGRFLFYCTFLGRFLFESGCGKHVLEAAPLIVRRGSASFG